ncbi:flagellar hook-associated protein FlgK [Nocardioides dongkuii]|uniref:flagellar hook-associated protein FlgK n=1 Tax=Nocardioides dongkuii TaxID=2760089 RepID=UPI0015F8DE64|nr:flagellar hook-associated protein FlgK [Nocardioides dongkuii]
MAGSLSSLNTALSALQYQRVAMDVASSNIANVNTEGYTRRRVQGESLGAPAVPAVWSRYDGAGGGVTASRVDRMVDPLLDARGRYEHGQQSFLQTRADVLARVEGGIGEPGDTGVSAALKQFRSSWHDLANNPGGEAGRSQVLATATSLADAIRAQASNITKEQGDQQARLVTVVGEVNTLAQELAATNRTLVSTSLSGVDNVDMLDRRDQLTMRLAELTGGVATIRPDGAADVRVGEAVLVSFDSTTPLDATAPPTGVGGELGAVRELLTTTLPAYGEALSEVAQTLADEVNALHSSGFDQDGAPGQALFAYDPANVAGTLSVALTDGRRLAASGLPGGVTDGSVADKLGGPGATDSAYQRLVVTFGTQVASAARLAATQGLVTAQVDGSREQLAGVNLDEEMVSMMSAQRSYEAAARVMTVVDSVLDTLINRTGLLR